MSTCENQSISAGLRSGVLLRWLVFSAAVGTVIFGLAAGSRQESAQQRSRLVIPIPAVGKVTIEEIRESARESGVRAGTADVGFTEYGNVSLPLSFVLDHILPIALHPNTDELNIPVLQSLGATQADLSVLRGGLDELLTEVRERQRTRLTTEVDPDGRHLTRIESCASMAQDRLTGILNRTSLPEDRRVLIRRMIWTSPLFARYICSDISLWIDNPDSDIPRLIVDSVARGDVAGSGGSLTMPWPPDSWGSAGVHLQRRLGHVLGLGTLATPRSPERSANQSAGYGS